MPLFDKTAIDRQSGDHRIAPIAGLKAQGPERFRLYVQGRRPRLMYASGVTGLVLNERNLNRVWGLYFGAKAQ